MLAVVDVLCVRAAARLGVREAADMRACMCAATDMRVAVVRAAAGVRAFGQPHSRARACKRGSRVCVRALARTCVFGRYLAGLSLWSLRHPVYR